VTARTRDFVFDNIDITKANRCFVKYHPRLREIAFTTAPVTTTRSSGTLTAAIACAVFSLKDSTWTFDDAAVRL
jgi:hypothetical protein